MCEEEIMCQCDICEETKLCRRASDPFVDEVYHEKRRRKWWCNDCYDSRHADV
jgi:hypothetical protein